jgi:hypothetical protein
MSFKNDIEKAIKANSVKRLEQACIKALGRTAENIVNDSKTNLRNQKAINNGVLLNSINASPVNQDLRVVIEASAFYASFIEFGTRKFAGDYVPTLPKEWKDIASQTKGKTRGTFEDMVESLTDWVSKKVGTDEDPEKVARAIAIKILRNGIRPRPYLYPAVTKNINNFRKELDKVFK